MIALGSRARGPLLLLLVLLCVVRTVVPASSEPQTRDRSPSFLRISLDPTSIDMVTTGSDDDVVVTGEIENFSEKPVTDVQARLQRAPAVLDSAQLGESLAEPEESYDTQGPFELVADRIPAHGKTRFRLSLPLRGPRDSLQIPNPGIYPVLVNVNGTPESGVRARLDDLRFLLPVLGLPSTGEDAAQPARIDHPTRLGLVLPIADHPRWAAGSVEGDGLVRLVDDELADELEPEGRLGVLVGGLDRLGHSPEPASQALRQATCVAVDPDLLRTVGAMAEDYLVPGPRGEWVLGKGSASARDWLAKLRAVLAGQCVTALPFAHADLAALAQLGDPQLEKTAFEQASDYVDSALSVVSARDLLVSSDTRIDTPVVDMLAAHGFHTVLAPRSTRSPFESRPLGPGLAAVQFDSSISALLGNLGGRPGPGLPPEDPVAQRQSAVASVLWPALQPSNPGQLPTTGGLELVVPPSVWSPSAADFDTLVLAASIALQAGIAKPASWDPVGGFRPLGADGGPETGQDVVVLEPKSVAKPFPAKLVDQAAQARAMMGGLVEGIVDQPEDPITANRYAKGWNRHLLRALAGGPSAEAAPARLAELRAALGSATGSVRLVDPGKPYTLFTEEGSLPVVVRNGLPVAMRVQLLAEAPSGVQVSSIASETVPAHGSRVLSLPVRAKAPKLSPVRIELKTAGGLDLGNPVTVSVQSGQYTGLLAMITAVIGALLLALVALRLWRRFTGRGRQGQRPRPDEHQRRMAGLGFKERALVESKLAQSAKATQSRHGVLPPDDD